MSDAMDRKEEKERTMTGRNKNMVCGALLCAMMLSMTACGNEIPDLTEEESQRIGEYAAVTLLKYDANNRSRLVDPEVVLGLHVVGITGREKAAGEQQHGKQQCQKHDDVKPQAVNDIATRSVLRSPHGNNSSVTTTINFNYASILAHLRSL